MTTIDGKSALALLLVCALALVFAGLWSSHGPEIAARLEYALAVSEAEAVQSVPLAAEPAIELLPDGVLIAPDIPADLAATLAAINQRYGTVIDYSTSHGVTKHKAEAIAVRKCLEDGGQQATLTNDLTGNKIRLCQVDDVIVGLQVIARKASGGWREITAYFMTTNSTVREAVYDMIDSGYILDWVLKEIVE